MIPERSNTEACTKISLPPRSGAMKPKPLLALYHFTVPISRTVDRAAAHIRNCELVVGSCHRRNHGGGSSENHGHGYSRRHFLLNFAALLGGPYHSRRRLADVLDGSAGCERQICREFRG